MDHERFDESCVCVCSVNTHFHEYKVMKMIYILFFFFLCFVQTNGTDTMTKKSASLTGKELKL